MIEAILDFLLCRKKEEEVQPKYKKYFQPKHEYEWNYLHPYDLVEGKRNGMENECYLCLSDKVRIDIEYRNYHGNEWYFVIFISYVTLLSNGETRRMRKKYEAWTIEEAQRKAIFEANKINRKLEKLKEKE